MGTPTLTLLNSTSINTAESITGWTQFDTLDPDIVKEDSNSITGGFRADGAVGYYDAGTAPVTAVGKTFRKWINTTNVPYIDTLANGGYELSCYDGSTTEYKTMFSSENYFGGWFNVVFDMDSFTTLTLANVQRWGLRCQHHTSAKNVDNVWTDAYKYLDGYSMTGGALTDPITLSDIEVADRGTTTLYGYGVVTEYGGVYYATGTVQFGTGATTMYFEMDGDILIFEDKPIAAGLYSLSGVGTGSTVVIQNNSTIVSAGTTDATRFVFDWSDANLVSFTCTDTLIVRASTSAFKSGQTVTGNTFNDCGQITHGGADMTDCVVKSYEGTANTSALVYNVGVDPDGEMDNMVFEVGVAATHAIEFGTTSPTTMTLRGCVFSGYNTADTQNDSTFHFKRTSGTVVLNLIGCSGEFTYRTDGATIDISIDPVTTIIRTVDSDGDPVAGATVIAEAADGSGDLPYGDTVSIVVSGTTATVTHGSHGLATNQYVVIRGVQNDEEYNGLKEITVTAPGTYTYDVVTGTPSPATGTDINSTGVAVTGTTDTAGEVSDARTYTADQNITGSARKASSAPYYEAVDFTDTVDNVNGLTKVVQLNLDQ